MKRSEKHCSGPAKQRRSAEALCPARGKQPRRLQKIDLHALFPLLFPLSAKQTLRIFSGVNLTGPDFLARKEKIVAALDREIRHGDLEGMAAIRRSKRTL